ncbi:MAG: hypothetical protein ABMA25_08260, partial [Ilumatobacteraceae bacterium]
MKRTVMAGLSVALLLAACSDDGSSSKDTNPAVGDVTVAIDDTAPPITDDIPFEADAALTAAVQGAVDSAAPGCDPLDTRSCLLPFPSNVYTQQDPTSDTGLRVSLPPGSLPANESGAAINVNEWNRNDGFSPNTPILAWFPDVDPEASKLPTWTDIGASLADDSTIVLLDTDTGERVPLWAELDAHAADRVDRLLTIRPAISLPEGHTFIVAIRGLVDINGATIEATPTFQIYRDNLTTGIEEIEYRRGEMNNTLSTLTDAGIDRGSLQLAWTFTVASTRNISERMLHIRDESLAALGDVAPAYTVTAVTPNSDDNIALQVEGTY